MQELSLNILDIAQNSVAAEATLIEISVDINTGTKKLVISVADNGKGMSEETLKNVTDPFYTTRTTRKVGLGLPFFKMAAEATGGNMSVQSTVGKGTTVTAVFTLGHIDLTPIGDISGTITALIQCNPDIDFIYRASADGESFCLDTREMREILGEVPLDSPEVALFLRRYLSENQDHIIQRSVISI